jgi:phosphate transport system substrate-binding protein
VSSTFIELPKDPKNPTRGVNVIKFFDWAFKNGDPIVKQLAYVPLPDAVKDAVRNSWHSEVHGPDGKPIF